MSAEYEFWFFQETAHSLREKNFRNLTALSPGMFGYSVLRASQNSPLVLQLLDQLAGFDVQLELPPPTTNAYAASNAPPLPRNLADATALFKKSAVARKWFGDEFVDHYAITREWEVRQYEKIVTDWELERYFELV